MIEFSFLSLALFLKIENLSAIFLLFFDRLRKRFCNDGDLTLSEFCSDDDADIDNDNNDDDVNDFDVIDKLSDFF